MALLDVQQLSVAYGPIRAVHGISLRVDQGEIVALIGNNGAGKSSTLNAVMGLVKPSGGQVLLGGEDVTGRSPERIMREGMTLTPEGRRIFAGLTVRENLMLGGGPRISRDEAERRAEELYEVLPILAERSDQLGETLSGGEQQQLAIARSLMSQPRMLLLDEPSLGLAPRIIDDIFAFIRRLHERGLTILLVEQSVEQALEIADRAYVLAAGQIDSEGAAAELLESTDIAAAYLGTGAA